MKKILIKLSLAVFVLFVNLVQAQESLVVVLNENNNEIIEEAEVGSIRFKDKAFKAKCTYQKSIEYLKETALSQNANLVKITLHKEPDGFNKCHRFDATFYNTTNPRKYEKEITWSNKRKLTWEDFRAEKKPPAYTATALSYCGIKYSAKSLTSLYANNTKYIVECIFYPEKSWVTNDVSQHTDEVLKHEQLHFDICEVYARRLYKELISAKLNAFNIDDANAVFQRIYAEYEERQIQYDEEVYSAADDEVQKKWDSDIAKELIVLAEYAERD